MTVPLVVDQQQAQQQQMTTRVRRPISTSTMRTQQTKQRPTARVGSHSQYLKNDCNESGSVRIESCRAIDNNNNEIHNSSLPQFPPPFLIPGLLAFQVRPFSKEIQNVRGRRWCRFAGQLWFRSGVFVDVFVDVLNQVSGQVVHVGPKVERHWNRMKMKQLVS